MRPTSKKDKLVYLQHFADLETGKLDESAFDYENSLYRKALKMKPLVGRIARCKRCPGLNQKRHTESCPGWGNLNADIFFIGQSLHEHGVVTGLPFILASGYSIDAALRLSGLLRKDVFMTNVVHCHPLGNRGSTDTEKKNCLRFLKSEIEIVWPKLVVALGNDAKQTVEMFDSRGDFGKNFKILKVKHPASFIYSAPEDRIQWIVKLSLEMDKVLK